MTIENTVSPTPSADEAVAIATALEMLWPKPQPNTSTTVQTSWRFSGRSWTDSVLARRSRQN
ncbi:MAG: hypothetical protein O3A62_02515 [Actinomycetota bacterium]|nr:hypothetical protein [Actinomycetota bacterium]MDA3003931.1 hypothetical protein [Actinomycetota bacterium]